jgi:succinyl-CoA synthetase beta subunit
LFTAAGIASPREVCVDTVDAAVSAARDLGLPVVLKSAAPEVAHRTELGLVTPALRDPSEVRHAAAALLEHGALLVQAFVVGIELFVSVDNTRGHAPLVTVARGGELVELESDRAFAIGPVSGDRAMELLGRLAVAPALRGYRGRAPADLAAAADVIGRLSRLAFDAWAQVAVAEINPLIVCAEGDGAIAVDGLVECR